MPRGIYPRKKDQQQNQPHDIPAIIALTKKITLTEVRIEGMTSELKSLKAELDRTLNGVEAVTSHATTKKLKKAPARKTAPRTELATIKYDEKLLAMKKQIIEHLRSVSHCSQEDLRRLLRVSGMAYNPFIRLLFTMQKEGVIIKKSTPVLSADKKNISPMHWHMQSKKAGTRRLTRSIEGTAYANGATAH